VVAKPTCLEVSNRQIEASGGPSLRGSGAASLLSKFYLECQGEVHPPGREESRYLYPDGRRGQVSWEFGQEGDSWLLTCLAAAKVVRRSSEVSWDTTRSPAVY